MRRLVAATAVLALALAGAGCASFEAVACGGPDDTTASKTVTMPDEVAGLRVRKENNATKKLNKETGPSETYQCEGGGEVYSLRDGKELRAVLQISRLAPDARTEDLEFLRNLVRGITGNILEPIEVNGVDVYKTVSQEEQFVTTWFHDHFMFFLSVRQDELIQGSAVDIDFDAVVTDAVAIVPA